MDGLPVTIRLLDPPLHEFLPNLTELSVRVAVAEANGYSEAADLKLLAAVQRLHESNPMLGLRGVRLGLVVPGLFALQVRAIAEAAVERIKAGGDPQGRDHGAAGGVGDGAAPGRGRDRRHRRGDRRARGHRPAHPDRHDDRAAASGPDRAPHRRRRGVLLLRHQRPHPDHLGVLPRRRRGRVLRHLPRQGRVHRVAVRDPRRRRGRAPGARSPPRRAAGPGPTSSSESAASTAATPSRSTSSTTSASTTSPARRSASPSPASKPAAPPSPAAASDTR